MKIRVLGVLVAVILLSSASPYVSKSTNGGNIAHAILLPVKVEHNSDGEIWQLPNGQNVFKSGGEAPPRLFDEGIKIDGSTLKSTVVDVDLDSLKESEIIYSKNSTIHSKENWFVYEKDIKLDWTSVINENLLIQSVPKSETVGGYVVTDYEKHAVKERNLFNDLGSLWIEYKLVEGNPLKHTLNFTASDSGVFKLCQEFSDIDYDEIRKVDEDSKSVEIVDVALVESDITDVKSVDKLSLSKSEIDDMKSELKSSLPELVEFKKNGKLVLGEITSGAKNDFQSFEFDSTTDTAKFCYGEFTLDVGESFLIDPDTYTSNDPTEDGAIETNAVSGTSCGSSTFAKTTGGEALTFLRASGVSDGCQRPYFEWPTTSISDSSSITNVVFKFEISTVGTARNCDYMALTNQPSVSTAATIWSDISSGSYVTNDSTCTTVGTNKSLDLGSTADTDLQNLLSANWFGVGVKFTSETRDGTNYDVRFRTEEGTSPTPKPTLEVTYSAPSSTLVTVNHYTGNTTALTTCNIIQTNSSTSRTIACDSSGMATFTGLGGNQNFTVKETNTNFVVNKTRNFSTTTNLIINATVVEVNCVQTGSATDVRIWLNQTDGHTITNFTRPICSTSNQQPIVVSWNATFSPDGKHSVNFNSDLRVDIRNTTAFGKDAIRFYHNNNENTTSYSSGIISSSDFPIGSGIGSSSLRKFYLWLDARPDTPSNPSATGVSTGQIDLSWTAGSSGVTPITGYKIYVSSDGGLSYSVLESNTGSSSTSYGHNGLTAGSTRYYKIAAINTYGAGENSTAFSGSSQSASSSSPSSGGGGGGGGIIQTVSGFTLNLIPKTSSMFVGETKSFDIDFTWDIIKSKNLIIKSITVPSGSFDSLSIIPEQLTGFGKTVVDGKSSIRVTVQTPSDVCSPDKPTAKCVNLRQYTIPLQIFVQDQDGNNYGPFTAVLELDIIKAVETGTTIILAVLVVVIIAISAFIVRSGSEKPSYPRNSKEHKKQYDNVIKNAKKVTKKGFFSKLLK